MSEKVLGFKKETADFNKSHYSGRMCISLYEDNLVPVYLQSESIPIEEHAATIIAEREKSLEWLEKELTDWNKIVSQDERLSLSAKCLVGRILNSVISKAKKEAGPELVCILFKDFKRKYGGEK